MAKSFLKFQVGDGSNISLWLDNWHPDGILYDKYGFWVIDDARRLEVVLMPSYLVL